MAKTPRRRNSKSQKPAFIPGKNPAQGYSPSAAGGGWWGTLQNAIQNGKPIFTAWQVPQMLTDPQILFGLSMLIAPCGKGKWDIQCADPAVKQFIDKMYHKFWTTAMPQVMERYLVWGAGPAVFEYDIDGDQVLMVNGKGVEPSDATVRVWKDGEEQGKFAGFDLRNGNTYGKSGQTEFVAPPYSFWFAGQERRGRFYDTSVLAGAYLPWLMKNTRGGGLDLMSAFFRKHAVGQLIIRHPLGPTDPSNPNSINNQDWARLMAERLESGSVMIVPQMNNPMAGDQTKGGDPAWVFEKLDSSGSAVDVLEWIEWCDKNVLIGLGIPPEVVEAQMGGLGQGGRAIPQEAFYLMTDLRVGPLIGAFDRYQVKPTVEHNFGDVKYTVESIPLADVDKMEAKEAQSSVGPDAAAGVQQGTETAPSEPQEDFDLNVQGQAEPEERGDPTAGGLIPYVGKYGGKGKKNPASGKVYYNLSTVAGRPLGCVMAPITGDLREACHEFQKTIKAKDLAADGLELDSHVTIRFGLHTHLHKPVFGALADLGSLDFEPAEIRCFAGDKQDVLYVSCGNPYRWSQWHESLGHLPNTETHAIYTPHLNLAYLKAGKGKDYIGQKVDHSEPVSIAEVEYHTPDGRTEKMAVWPSAEEMAELMREKQNLGWMTGAKGGQYWLPEGEEDIPPNRLYGQDAQNAANAGKKNPDEFVSSKPRREVVDDPVGITGAFNSFQNAYTETFVRDLGGSLKKTGEVMPADKRSIVGQSWELVKSKFGNTPESQKKFVAAAGQAIDKGHTPQSWNDALNQAFSGQSQPEQKSPSPATQQATGNLKPLPRNKPQPVSAANLGERRSVEWDIESPKAKSPQVAQPVNPTAPLPVAKPVPGSKPPVLQPAKPQVAKPSPGQGVPTSTTKQQPFDASDESAAQNTATPGQPYQPTPEYVAHAEQWASQAAQTKAADFQKLGVDPQKHGPAIQKAASKAMLRLREEMAKNPKITTLKFRTKIGGKTVVMTISKKPQTGKVNLSHSTAGIDEWELAIAA